MILKVVYTVLLVVASAIPCIAQDDDYELRLSGKLVDLLPDDTRLVFWHPSTKITGAAYSAANLPERLPAAKFSGKTWHVNFISETQGQLFSVTLSQDLFDKPRTITIKLDQPNSHIRPTFFFGKNVAYFAGITKRMRYRDLPYWDDANDSFGTPIAPVMTMTCLKNGETIHDAPMEDGCMASRWWAFIDKDVSLQNGVTYRFAVTYDSGGLFPTFETTTDFTFYSDLHPY